jgi:hypothetical protein
MEYGPKGSMCFSCKDLREDCSHLPFHTMRMAKQRPDGVMEVICTMFKRADNRMDGETHQ